LELVSVIWLNIGLMMASKVGQEKKKSIAQNKTFTLTAVIIG